MFGFLSSGYNAIKKAAEDAATAVATSDSAMEVWKQVILGKITSSITKSKARLDEVSKLELLESSEAIQALLKQSRTEMDALEKTVTSDAVLLPIMKVAQQHSKAEGIMGLYSSISESNSLGEMGELLAKLFNKERYKTLFDNVTDLTTYSEQDKKRQAELKEYFNDKALPKAIEKDSKRLTLNFFKTNMGTLANKLEAELKLNKESSAKVLDVFNGIIDKHFKGFNALTQQTFKAMPSFQEKMSQYIDKLSAPEPGKAITTALSKSKAEKRSEPASSSSAELTSTSSASPTKKQRLA